jgi:hypothetical protein
VTWMVQQISEGKVSTMALPECLGGHWLPQEGLIFWN